MTQAAAFDPREFRNALGTYPTGVTVVTTVDAQGQPRGFTANSFTSVSLEPPLLLVCLAKNAHSHPIFTKAENFGVNILSDRQKDVSGLFASKASDKFEKVDWNYSELKTPVISKSLATFNCQLETQVEAGDHTILIGRVKSFKTDAGKPLGYCRGAYVQYQDSTEIEAAIRGGARVSAIIETPKGIVMTKGTQGLNLPVSSKLGAPKGETGLHKILQDLGLKAALDFVFSVYEDDHGPCVIYRGRSPGSENASTSVSYLQIEDIEQFESSDPATLTVLKRYAKERSQDLYGIYVGDAKAGQVFGLKTN
jgi:flavin reductase (DIM6/NTAB) family NADH-FMN oxidoreductase RutF